MTKTGPGPSITPHLSGARSVRTHSTSAAPAERPPARSPSAPALSTSALKSNRQRHFAHAQSPAHDAIGCHRRRLHDASALRRVAGFTLIETAAVVVVIGILSAVVLVRIGYGSIGRPGVRTLAQQLALDLRHARGLAIAEGVNHYVGFNPNGFGVFRRATPSSIAVEDARPVPRGIGGTISAWDFEFDPTGAALAGYWCDLYASGVTYRVAVVVATGTVTVTRL